jgi:hypothetical protein
MTKRAKMFWWWVGHHKGRNGGRGACFRAHGQFWPSRSLRTHSPSVVAAWRVLLVNDFRFLIMQVVNVIGATGWLTRSEALMSFCESDLSMSLDIPNRNYGNLLQYQCSMKYRFYFACIVRCIGLCHYYQGERTNNSEKPEIWEKTKDENRWGRGGSMLKRELSSPRNKKNGEGKQKPGKTRKWGHLTLCYPSRTWVQVFHTELISSILLPSWDA